MRKNAEYRRKHKKKGKYMKRLLNNLQKRRRERKEAPIKSLENAKNLPAISSLTSSRSRGGKKFY